jgi:hypothetical protein
MTVVGKILVFLNLVFSLVVGAFGVMTYAARTHWAKGYEDLKAQYAQVDASRRAFQEERDQLASEKAALNEEINKVAGKNLELNASEDVNRVAKRLTETLAALQDREKAQKDRIDDLQRQLAAEKRKVGSFQTVALVAQKDVERRQADVETVRKTLKDETERNNTLVKQTNEMRDEMVAAKIQASAFKDVAERMETEMRQMARDIERLKASGAAVARGGRAGAGSPPPEDVEGFIKRTDPSGLVTITLGSDQGLAKGQTMQVFRLGPKPRYVGAIQILEVTHTQAVGQAVRKPTTPIQVGDRVASRIMPGD